MPARSSVERADALREHLTLTHELLPLMSRARTYASWYLKGMPHAAAWRAHVVRCSTYEEFMALVDEIERDVVACEAALAAGEVGACSSAGGLIVAVTALYVHVPFCAQKCRYCDFDSRSFAPCDLSAALDAYFEQLFARLDAFGKAGALDQIRTVYVGGGTPSLAGSARWSWRGVFVRGAPLLSLPARPIPSR